MDVAVVFILVIDQVKIKYIFLILKFIDHHRLEIERKILPPLPSKKTCDAYFVLMKSSSDLPKEIQVLQNNTYRFVLIQKTDSNNLPSSRYVAGSIENIIL